MGLLTIIVLLDLSATFDTISHSILMERLAAIGINVSALFRFTPTVSIWNQRVCTGKNARSTPAPVKHGIPQGSVLGTTSIHYIHSSPLVTFYVIHFFQFHYYADDTLLFQASSFLQWAQSLIHYLVTSRIDHCNTIPTDTPHICPLDSIGLFQISN